MLCKQAIEVHLLEVLIQSGRFINQMGVFYECVQSPGLKYLHLYLKYANAVQPNGFFVGMCLPTVCDSDQVMKRAVPAVPAITKGLMKAHSVVDNPQLYSYPYDWLFYLTVTLLSIITFLCIFSTFVKKPKILQAFNLRKACEIFKYRHNALNVFNGIKSLCMMWVIFGHQYSVRLTHSINLPTIGPQVQTTFYLLVTGAFYAVDVFFYIGGFLVAYSFLRTESKSVVKYPMALLHRLLRFWPSYLMAILIFVGIYMHLGSGPFWGGLQSIVIQPCQKLWKPMLFVDNLVDNGESMCMGWGWYLQNDMQIFMVSLLALFIYSKNRMASYLFCLAIVMASFIYSFVATYVNQYVLVAHLADFAKWSRYFPDIYIKPWSRCPPYLYGLILGSFFVEYIKKKKANDQNYFLIRFERKLRESKRIQWILEGTGIAIMLFILFIPRTLQVGYVWPQFFESAFLTFSKTIFVVGLSITVTPSLLDIPSMVSFCMDTKFFNFVGKISFWTYLIHYMVLMRTDYEWKVDFYYGSLTIFPAYIAHVIGAVFFGFLGTMLIEVPFSKLEKKMFEKLLSKQKRKETLVSSLQSSVNSSSIASSQILNASLGGSLLDTPKGINPSINKQ